MELVIINMINNPGYVNKINVVKCHIWDNMSLRMKLLVKTINQNLTYTAPPRQKGQLTIFSKLSYHMYHAQSADIYPLNLENI